MPRPVSRIGHPLSMRLPEADATLIDRAAGLRGRSRTDFVREAAVRAAEQVVMERALIRMSATGFDAFMTALGAPAARLAETVALLKRRAPWEADPARD